MTLQAALDQFRRDGHFMSNVATWEHVPSRTAREADFPAALDPTLVNMLHDLGITRLYSHQAQATAAALDGKNVVVVTPTASGKTLCYNLPVLQTCLRDPKARALYLFPTKALAQDQSAALNTLLNVLDTSESANKQIGVHVYDGDTPNH